MLQSKYIVLYYVWYSIVSTVVIFHIILLTILFIISLSERGSPVPSRVLFDSLVSHPNSNVRSILTSYL